MTGELIACCRAMSGERDKARGMLRESIARMKRGYVPSSALALMHLGLGEDDKVMECLNRGHEERDALMPWLGVLPDFDRLRSDPRFQNLLRRMRLHPKPPARIP
jgi:serine/threonine-protein kinase